MLTYWIPDGPCMLPANASHQVGVGGFVINHKNEVYNNPSQKEAGGLAKHFHDIYIKKEDCDLFLSAISHQVLNFMSKYLKSLCLIFVSMIFNSGNLAD